MFNSDAVYLYYSFAVPVKGHFKIFGDAN